MESVPAKTLFSVQPNNFPSFDTIRENIKLNNKKQLFLNSMEELLKYYNQDEFKYNHTLLLCLMQSCEDFFAGKRGKGQLKKETVIQAAMKFFDNNEQLISTIIEEQMPKLTQCRYWRGWKIKIVTFFSKLVPTILRQLC